MLFFFNRWKAMFVIGLCTIVGVTLAIISVREYNAFKADCDAKHGTVIKINNGGYTCAKVEIL